MRRKIAIYLLSIFLLFGIGGGVAIVSLTQVSQDLNTLITLHRVEILRQDLVINLQYVQSNLYTVGTSYGAELDVIVENVSSLDEAVNKCSGCHHVPELANRLQGVAKLVEKYKDALSAFITTTANPNRVTRLQSAAVQIGDILLQETHDMTSMANRRLQIKTALALDKVKTTKDVLLVSLFSTMLIGFIVALSLTERVLRPIRALSEMAMKVASGKLGATTDYSDSTEFGQLAKNFNEMSRSLKDSHEKTLHHLAKLAGLYESIISLHTPTNKETIVWEMIRAVEEIIKVEGVLVVLYDPSKNEFVPFSPSLGMDREEIRHVSYESSFINNLYEKGNRGSLILEAGDPLIDRLSLGREDVFRNLTVIWMAHKGALNGFVVVMNKKMGNFVDEDIRLLGIITTNLSVALDNSRLYEDINRQMQKLRDTQEQLIQAAKLAAVGELAANVAHEINNPLTTMLGYAQLLREENDVKSIKRDLRIIESEALRARDIVQQLLEFSKKRELNLEEVDINQTIADVLRFLSPKIKTPGLKIVNELNALPSIIGDENQLKQVLLNLINNAIQAMPKGGTLVVRTIQANGSVVVEVSDTGLGIPQEILQRIFEPFFTTKKDKGTGLGLPISYRIIEEHAGRIEVKSREKEGTTFKVILPIRESS
jgi:signal transduction histidine kinase/HAMP domain-containing protein